MVALKELELDVLQDRNVVALAQRRLKRKHDLTQVKVLALEGLDGTFEITDLLLQSGCNEEVLRL